MSEHTSTIAEGPTERCMIGPSTTLPAPPDWIDDLEDSAYYGVLGEIVRALEPVTEADPAAMLIQGLTIAGNILGRGCYLRIGGSRHYPCLFTLVVGTSSLARKGTSLSTIMNLFKAAMPNWCERVQNGLSSGEGLIQAVADPVLDDHDELASGTTDRRLLIVEQEYARVLSLSKREGNILTQVVREAWDGGRLATMTRSSSLQASEAHVAIIAHITQADLQDKLSRAELSNGFANRHLFVLARRRKELPRSPCLDDITRTNLVRSLEKALTQAGLLRGEIVLSHKAELLFDSVYSALTRERKVTAGEVVTRGAPYVKRIAMIFALLDGKTTISTEHLRAALAVWSYCEDSAFYCFAANTGNKVGDKCYSYLRQSKKGRASRTELHIEALKRNAKAHDVDIARDRLLELQLIEVSQEKPPEGGRATEYWMLVG